MLDTGKDSATTADRQTTGSTNSLGLKGFNSVGREDSTYERLKPQISAEQRNRNFLLVSIVIVLLVVVGFLAFKRSGLSLIPSEDNGHSFQQPQMNSESSN